MYVFCIETSHYWFILTELEHKTLWRLSTVFIPFLGNVWSLINEGYKVAAYLPLLHRQEGLDRWVDGDTDIARRSTTSNIC